MNGMFDAEIMPGYPDIMDVVHGMPKDKPRTIKTHLSWDMMPDQFWQKKSKVTRQLKLANSLSI